MQTHSRKFAVTFERPFQIEGLAAVLPAGLYQVERENDVVGGVFLPETIGTPLRIHMHTTPGGEDYTQTLTISWAALLRALERDRGPAAPSLRDAPTLDELLKDPMVQLLMRSDRVSDSTIRRLVSQIAMRRSLQVDPT